MPRRIPTPARTPDAVTVLVPRPASAGSGSAAVAAVLNDAADAHATVVLSGHVQPDADALGSALALAEGLRRRGARVLTTFPDPFTLPPSLQWLPGAAGLVASADVIPPEATAPQIASAVAVASSSESNA